jgi:hypothetical protein
MIAITPLYTAYIDTNEAFVSFSGSCYVPILIKFYNMSCTINYGDEQGYILLVVSFHP